MTTRRDVAAGLVLLAAVATVFIIWVPLARADGDSTQSVTGTLSSSSSVFETTLTLAVGGDVLLQTYGFGGGTNAQGTVIAAGGTDPFLAIFSGTGDAATILTDAFANPFGTSAALSNYGSFAGCPPAGTVNIGGSVVCGDITMSPGPLAAGTYTIVLSDGQYLANAVFDDGTLGEGFTDFTGGAFCNTSINGVACPNTSGAYALDVTTTTPMTPTPEPASLFLAGSAMLGIFYKLRRQSSRPSA
jgi:PEP-CTERM motif